jgi:hypothetical protein
LVKRHQQLLYGIKFTTNIQVLKAATVTISASSVPGRFQHPYRTATQTNASTQHRYSQLRSTDSANYNSLLGSAGNFVIGKATPTATLWYQIHHKRIQVLVKATVLFLPVLYQVSLTSNRTATQLMRQPMLLQPTSFNKDTANYNSPHPGFQQGL